jgi:hypothetical protein
MVTSGLSSRARFTRTIFFLFLHEGEFPGSSSRWPSSDSDSDRGVAVVAVVRCAALTGWHGGVAVTRWSLLNREQSDFFIRGSFNFLIVSYR